MNDEQLERLRIRAIKDFAVVEQRLKKAQEVFDRRRPDVDLATELLWASMERLLLSARRELGVSFSPEA